MFQRDFFEDCNAEHLKNCGGAGVQTEPFPDDGHQNTDGDGYPYLGLDGVLGGAEERLDPEVLLYPLEEQFNLPTAPVEFGDGGRRQREVVCQEDQCPAGSGVVVFDASQLVRIAPGGLGAGEQDGLVAAEPRALVHRARVRPAEAQVGLGSDDEEGGAGGQRMQPAVVQATAVHDVEGAGLGCELVEHVDVVELAVRDVCERGDAAPEAHQGVELDSALGGTGVGPREQRQAQVDGGGVERVDGAVKIGAEILVQVESARGVDQGLGEVGVNAPVHGPVGVRQGVARDRPCGRACAAARAGRPKCRAGSRGRSAGRTPCSGNGLGR